MQTQTPAPPAPPAPEPMTVQVTPGTRTTTRTSSNVVVTQAAGTIAVPRTREEYRALETRQREVGSQLTSAANRRKSVAAELEKAHDPANQNGLQQRLQVLDTRVARLESELDEVGRALASAPYSALPQSATTAVRGGGRDMTEAAQIVSVVVPTSLFFVLGMTALGMWFRRNRRGPAGDGRSKAEIERLDRLEQAVETIAVEMERVSEGQRFVTRILTEGKAGPAPVFGSQRQGEPLPVASRPDKAGH